MVHDATSHQHEGEFLRHGIWLRSPVYGLEESLALWVYSSIRVPSQLAAGKKVRSVRFARVDIGPEFEVFIQALAAARITFVTRPTHRPHLEDQLVAHARIVTRPALRDAAPFVERRTRLGESNERLAAPVLEAEPVCDIDKDIEIRARLPWRIDRLEQEIDATIRIGHASGFFAPHGHRKVDVGELHG